MSQRVTVPPDFQQDSLSNWTFTNFCWNCANVSNDLRVNLAKIAQWPHYCFHSYRTAALQLLSIAAFTSHQTLPFDIRNMRKTSRVAIRLTADVWAFVWIQMHLAKIPKRKSNSVTAALTNWILDANDCVVLFWLKRTSVFGVLFVKCYQFNMSPFAQIISSPYPVTASLANHPPIWVWMRQGKHHTLNPTSWLCQAAVQNTDLYLQAYITVHESTKTKLSQSNNRGPERLWGLQRRQKSVGFLRVFLKVMWRFSERGIRDGWLASRCSPLRCPLFFFSFFSLSLLPDWVSGDSAASNAEEIHSSKYVLKTLTD